tara:strand:+ start:5030 stop:8059 length:3030 start_codon:yes stop_codon:yes gene_type:complete
MSYEVGVSGVGSSDTSKEAQDIRTESASAAKAQSANIDPLKARLNANLSALKEAEGNSDNVGSLDAYAATGNLLNDAAVLLTLFWKQAHQNGTSFALGNPRSGAALGQGGFAKTASENKGPYDSFFSFKDDMPKSELISISSILNKNPSAQPLLDINTEQISALVPYVKLYKLVPSGNKHEVVEFPFSNKSFGLGTLAGNIGLEQILTNRAYRGADAGITDVKWTFEGTDPVTANKFIKLEATIFLSNINGLTLQRKTTTGHPFRYSDLIRRTSNMNQNPKIYASLGWSIPPKGLNDGIITPQLRAALYLSRYSLDLNLMEHEFSFNENGSCELKVGYQASILMKTGNDNSNLLTANIDNRLKEQGWTQQQQQELNRLKVEHAKRNRKESQNAHVEESGPTQDLQALENRYQAIKRTVKAESEQVFMDAIVQNRAVKEILLPRELYWKNWNPADWICGEDQSVPKLTPSLLQNYQNLLFHTRSGTNVGSQGVKGDLKESADKMKRNTGKGPEDISSVKGLSKSTIKIDLGDKNLPMLEKIAQAGFSGNTLQLVYCHLGDVLDAGFEILKKNGLKRGDEGFPNVVFGTIPKFAVCKGSDEKFSNPSGYINMVDLPVPMGNVMHFLNDYVIGRNMNNYSIMDYIYDVLTRLVPKMFYSAFGSALGLRFIPKLDIVHAKPTSDGATLKGNKKSFNPLTRVKRAPGQSLRFPPLSKIGEVVGTDGSKEFVNEGDIRETYTFVMVNLEIIQPNEKLKPDYQRDFKNGVYWLNLAADNGLVKGWSFSKTDAPYLSESRVFGENGLGREDISGGNLYNLNITMVGNGLFKPGSLVFVNPNGLGFDAVLAEQLMIGGYYTVVKLDHEITSGGYDTNVELVYLRSADPDQRMKLGVTGGNTTKGAVTGPEVKVNENVTTVIGELGTGFIGDAQGNQELIRELASGKHDDLVDEAVASAGVASLKGSKYYGAALANEVKNKTGKGGATTTTESGIAVTAQAVGNVSAVADALDSINPFN